MNKKGLGWGEIASIIIVLLIILVSFILIGNVSDIGGSIVEIAPDFDGSIDQGLFLFLLNIRK